MLDLMKMRTTLRTEASANSRTGRQETVFVLLEHKATFQLLGKIRFSAFIAFC